MAQEENKKPSKKIGLAIAVSVVLGIAISWYGYYKSCQPKILTISTTEWTEVKKDPKKEWIEWSRVDPTVWYYVVVNKDFKNPRRLPDPAGEFKSTPGSKTLDFMMGPGQDSDTMELKLFRSRR